jgi:hypothetical protein
MSAIARWNIIVGFSAIVFAASGGLFLANEQTATFIQNSAPNSTWWYAVASSAHGHTNLFGFLHILFGLTLGLSYASSKLKKIQFIGLALGTTAMSLLMLLRSLTQPNSGFDLVGYFIGFMLSSALISLATHIMYLLPRKRL